MISTILSPSGYFLIKYVLKGKLRQCRRKSELAARRREQELQAEIDASNADRAAAVEMVRRVCAESGEDGDWRALLWKHASAIDADPQDDAARQAGRVLADLARADLAIRRQQKGELTEADARKLLDDPELAARVDAMLGGK